MSLWRKIKLSKGIHLPSEPRWLRQQRICLQCGRPGFNPWVGKISWRRKWQPTPVFLPGKSHGRRSLVGYSPWGCKELDMTERLHFSLSAIKVASSAYLRLLIFLLEILIPACDSSSPAFWMMYSAYKLNKPGDNI